MLKDRLRTSAILIAVIVALLYVDSAFSVPGAEGLWLLPLLLFFALGTAWDACSMFRGSGRSISNFAALWATAIVSLSAGVPLLWPLFGSTYPPDCPVGRLGWVVIGGVAAIFLILLVEMKVYGKAAADGVGSPPDRDADTEPGSGWGAIERTSAAVFVSLYVGLPMALFVSLRSLGDGNWGLAALLTTITVTKSADVGAYFAGKSFGKHKLIPRLSPGKTREGLVGGIVTATIVAFVCLQWLFPLLAHGAAGPVTTPSISGIGHPFWGAILLGPLLTIAGIVGDLSESLVKRESGSKDSGSWLPGLGGVWDVTDSLIAAIMPAYLCFAAGVAS